MTSERLERLRNWTKAVAGKEVAFVYSDGVLRLLDEREALLGALRAAFDALEIAGEGRFHQDALQAAGDAIVKAESP